MRQRRDLFNLRIKLPPSTQPGEAKGAKEPPLPCQVKVEKKDNNF